MCVVDGRLDVNVALNRPSWLSSTWPGSYSPHLARYGNDGDKSLCDIDAPLHSIAASWNELNPWFALDLGVELHVAGVGFVNRGDWYSGKCTHYSVK